MPIKIIEKGIGNDAITVAVINRELIDESRIVFQILQEIHLQLLGCKEPANVQKIIFQECEIAMDPLHFFTLLFASESSLFSHVEVLDMDSSSIGDAGLTALSNLFYSNPLSFKKLNSLSLRRNHITQLGLSHLLQRLISLGNQLSLTSIYLSQNNIGSEGALLLANLLPSLPLLRTLHISYNHIGLQGATALSSILQQHHHCALESFSIMCNPYGLEGTKRILNALSKNRRMKSLIIGNTPPFCNYYEDYPDSIPFAERPTPVLKESETLSTILADYLKTNPLLRQIVIFGLFGEDVIDCLQSGMMGNTLIESITIPSTLSPILQDMSPILPLMTTFNALEYIKCTDGFNEIETTQPGKSVETIARDIMVADCIKVLRVLPLLDKVLPDLYETILKSLLIDGFVKCDRDVLVAYLLNGQNFRKQMQRFSANELLRLAYQSIEHFPTTD